MTLQRNIFIASIVTIGICALVFLFGFAQHAKANPSGYIRKQLSTATTSPIFMTPGTATTTAIVDCGNGGASSFGCESGVLGVQFIGSSTAAVLVVKQEFAQGGNGIDCSVTPLACDWYEASQTAINNVSTTTAISGGAGYDIGSVPQFQFQFTNSLVGGVLFPTASSSNRILTFQSPTRYTRFVFSLKIGAGNGAVWWEYVAKKQNN